VNQQIIVPRKGIQELARLLSGDDSDSVVRIGHNHILIELDSIRFISKLIDGKFPDYHRAIPEQSESERVAAAERLVLRDALARTAILAGDRRGVRLQLEKDLLRVQAHNPEQEQAEEDVAVGYQNDPLEIGFNVNYLMDALNNLSSEHVLLYFSDAGSSCLLLGSDEESCKYVVSPMRL
jgi:DNA polymerase-3 subunit beta